jgi:copper chaperone CopZ
MKKLSFLLLLAVSIHFTAQAQFKKASLQAAGLTCAMCSNATLKALKTLPFVDKIDTDLNNTTFILHFKPDASVNIDQIKQKVEDAGFSVAKLVLTAGFDQVKVSNDMHISYAGNTLHFINVKDQTLQGEKNITVIDRNFVTTKQFKKFSAQTDMSCYKTGTMGDCCKTAGKPAGAERVYHVTI